MDHRFALRQLFITSLMALLFSGLLLRTSAAADLPDPTPRIAIASAFEPEWVELKRSIAQPSEHLINGRSFITGKLSGKDVVLFLSGVSMVNAAMNTQIALDRFRIHAILFSGIAGGVDPALHIGDVVVADRWGEYLETVLARETAQGFAIPPWMEKSDFAGFGMMMPRNVAVTRKDAAPESRFWFPSDPSLLAIARKVAARTELTSCVTESSCLHNKPRLIIGGNGVSGSAFVDNAKFREYVLATFQAKLLDMESAAVAHVAYANSVPFLAVRSLSDLAGGGGAAGNEMMTFLDLAAKNSATVVKAILAQMP